MKKLIYQVGQHFKLMLYKKSYYCLILIAFYIGLLLPIFCLANIRSVGQIFYYTVFDGIEKSVTIDWFSKSFDLIDVTNVRNASVSAQYEENFINWNNQYVTIQGSDSHDFYPQPKLEGRGLDSKDYNMGRKVCIVGVTDAKKHKLSIGDHIQIRKDTYKIVGIFTDPKMDTIKIPYKAMMNTYQNTEKIQFSGCFLYDSPKQGKEIEKKVTEEIQRKDKDAQILNTIEGREILEGALQSRKTWRQTRILFMVISCLFFLCNEAIVLMAKIEREKKAIAIQLAMGAGIREVKAGYLFETLLITLTAAGASCVSLMPLARIFSLENAVEVDMLVISLAMTGSILVCEIMMWLILCPLKNTQICELLT